MKVSWDSRGTEIGMEERVTREVEAGIGVTMGLLMVEAAGILIWEMTRVEMDVSEAKREDTAVTGFKTEFKTG